MGKLFLGILAVCWGAVLIPAGFRRRSERGQFSILGLGASIMGLAAMFGAKRSQRNAVPVWSSDGYNGGPVPPLGGFTIAGPKRVSRSVRRQRQIVLGLVSLAIVTLMVSFIPGFRAALIVHAVVDLVGALYIVLLVRHKQSRPSVHMSTSAYEMPSNMRLPRAS